MATNLSEWYSDIRLAAPGCPNPLINRYLLFALRDLCEYSGVWAKMLTPIDSIVVEGEDDIAFVTGSPCTITSTETEFDTAGFSTGDEIVTDYKSDDSDEKDNSGPYTLATVATNKLTLASTDSLVSVDAGDDIYISKTKYALSYSGADISKVTHVKYDGEPLKPKTEKWLDDTVPYWRTDIQAQPVWYLVDEANKYLRLVYAPGEAIENALEVWVELIPETTATTVEDFLFTKYRETIAAGALSKLLVMPKQKWSNPSMVSFYQGEWKKGRVSAWYDGHKGPTHANFEIRA